MAQPPAYTPNYDFSDFEATNPDDPKPGTELDSEFGAIANSIDGIRDNLALIQKDDGSLTNGLVTLDSLANETLTALGGTGFNFVGEWVTATAYAVLDVITKAGDGTYVCIVAHTSGTFSTDLTAGKWVIISTEAGVESPALTSIANLVTVANKMIYTTAPDTYATTDLTAFARTLLGDANAAAALVTLGITIGAAKVSSNDTTPGFLSTKLVAGAGISLTEGNNGGNETLEIAALPVFSPPIGQITEFAGTAAPSGWILCYGQAISRTTYSALFGVVGTTYGVGDGSTTFNLPDCRGRVSAGKDDMGGSSANRLTNVSGSLDGGVLGAVGGAETHTLTNAQIPTIPLGFGSISSGSSGHNTVDTINNTGSGTSVTLNPTGGSAHPNMQPTIIFNTIIFAGV